METRFDDLRPYEQPEIAPAMRRIAGSEYLPVMAAFIFPEKTAGEVRSILSDIRTTDEFQARIMHRFNREVIRKSVTAFTCDGLEHLHPDGRYLFISNHRDIMLDSSLLQTVFHEHGLRTTEITFGSNLMCSPLVIDIGKSNKMFTVLRGGSPRDFYRNSMHLSEYIRHTVTRKGESVWIAQRNGRTKDGNDATDQGIIKMFCLSDSSDLPRSMHELHPVPVAISYQIESCDILKTRELYLSRGGRKYVKRPDEDLTSILTGITQPKGNIHIRICAPLCGEELRAIRYQCPNEFYKSVATLIDRRIYRGYRLHGNNYIAHDLRSGRDTYAAHYTPEEKARFLARCEQMLQEIEGDEPALRSIFLGIYANPVDNCEVISG
ncbi:MAG: 1-acyl-sn-glycerol-3-phosphate acyltransferase [Tannerella sp.]|jgi:hypothetical protein|nr:1-acyl-sn-glycerol-3-phosphate acyltransferase [Tannerella sp.]